MKNYTIGILILVVIVGGLMLLKPEKSTDLSIDTVPLDTNETIPVNNTTVVSTGGKVSTPKPSTPLATNLFPQKGSYECRYDQITQQSRSTNIVYISNGKMRGEFRTTDAKGMTMSNIMVYSSPYLYMWVEGRSVGIVTQPKSLTDIPVVVPTDIHEGKVLGSGINSVGWDCHAWSKVPSLLEKPTYVKFY